MDPATAIGTASAVVGLVGTAFSIIQHIRQARARVKGTSKALEEVSSQLDAVSTSLEFVREEPRLHSPRVEEQVATIVVIAKLLNDFFEKVQTEQTKGTLRQFAHALKSGDDDDKELAGILTRLSGARQDLIVRLSVVNVGLTGSLDDKFQVAQNAVKEINDKLEAVLGISLAMAKHLQERHLTTTTQEMVILDEVDVQALGLRNEEATAANTAGTEKARADTNEVAHRLNWNLSTTGDDARFRVGDTAVGESERGIPVNASIEKSNFGKNASFMIGTVGKDASKGFDDFWTRR